MRTIFGCLALAVAGLGLSLSDSTRLLDPSDEANAVGAGYFTRKACVLVSHNGCYINEAPGPFCTIGTHLSFCPSRDIYTCQFVYGLYDTCTTNQMQTCPLGQIYQCQNDGFGVGRWVLVIDNMLCGSYDICIGAP
jgi:hypothetical protein